MSAPIAVIGAGVGGLSTAIRLCAAGQEVVLLEQNASVGGKMGELCDGPFRWDTGPSVITMRHVLEDLFTAAGRRLQDYLTLLPVDPLTRYFYPDGTVLDATQDQAAMAQRIGAIAPQDVDGYRQFLAYAAEVHRITGPVFIYGRQPTWRSFLQVPLSDALRVNAWRTMQSQIDQHVKATQLRQLLGRFATYAGSSPYQASATLSVIADVEMSGGVWYPQGGVFAIASALERLARELGVNVRTGQRVCRIALEREAISGRQGSDDPRRVCGVELADGEVLAARAVVANVDVATVYRRLLPGVVRARRLRRLEAMEPSCSGFVLLLGVRGEQRQLAHHNIFFSGDYRREFDEIFRQGRLPTEPTIYVSITSKSDPSHAPPGHENWFVLVNAPALPQPNPGAPVSPSPVHAEAAGAKGPWGVDAREAPSSRLDDRDAQAYRDLILDRLATFDLDVRARIVSQHIVTPHDLQEHTGAWRGALYGTSMNSLLAPFRRPGNRSPDLNGLYFVGGTTHPGGGVPMVMLSAKVVTELMAEDELLAT